MKVRPCELCPTAAALYCPSDAAFLCRTCDAKIHNANFLVARHLRQSICPTCHQFTEKQLSGADLRPSAATCSTCARTSAAADSDSDSDSSVCISSTTDADSSSTISSRKRRRRPYKSPAGNNLKAEGIFVNWCGKLGIEADSTVKMACKGLRACSDRWTVLPFRVGLAASMWLGLKLSLDKPVVTWKVLKRLEEISGVPAKLILAAESKLERALSKEQRHRDLKEGWAEC